MKGIVCKLLTLSAQLMRGASEGCAGGGHFPQKETDPGLEPLGEHAQ